MGGTEFSFCFSSRSSQPTIANPVLGHPPKLLTPLRRKSSKKTRAKEKSLPLGLHADKGISVYSDTERKSLYLGVKSTAIVSANVYF